MNTSSCIDKYGGVDETIIRGFGSRGVLVDISALLVIVLTLCLSTMVSSATAQTAAGPGPIELTVQLEAPRGESAPPITVTLQDALARARQNDSQLLSTMTDVKIAREDRNLAKAALLPTVSYSTQYLGTQGNGITPNGRFVTNDGVHVYRNWGVLHQEISSNTFLATGYRRAAAAEALAKARAEIAQRGLVVTVTKNYYALVISQRKYAGAQQNAQQAKHFLAVTQDAERLGQVAHSDVIKADIQYEQQAQTFEEARLALENARLSVAVLLSSTLNENFAVVDDLDSAPPLPAFPDVQSMAERQNPDVRVALEAFRQADLDVTAAKGSFFPALVIDTDYGIEANAFALHSVSKGFPEAGKLPNLGYFVTASLNVPVWNWGALRSKLHQTQDRRQQARVELNQTQRQVLSNLYASYNEAAIAHAAADRLSRVADLASESLRLMNLRYQAGTSTALEVVDAQNTLIQARNAFNDARGRYRVALANLQTITGTF